MGNIRPRQSYVPEVRAPFSPQPTLRGNEADSLFSAQAKLGETAERVGQFFVNKARTEAEQEDSFLTQKSFIDEATQAQTILNDRKNNAALGDPVFADNVLKEFEKRHADLLAKAQANGMDPENLKKFDLQLSDLRKTISASATTFQNATRTAYLGGQTDDAVAKLSRLVFADPQYAQKAQAQLHALIDDLPGIDAIDKQKMYNEAWSAVSLMAGYGEAERNPQGVVTAFKSTQLNTRATATVNKFVAAGFTREQAAGIVGNLIAESNLDSNNTTGDGGVSHGIAQWNGDRLKALKAFASSKGKPWNDYDTQLDFIIYELSSSESTAGQKLRASKTVEEATAAFIGYERPQGFSWTNPKGGHNYAGRLANANKVAGGSLTGVAGGTGNPVLDNLTGPQQLTVLNAAQANVNRQQTDLKTAMSVLDDNAKDGYLNNGGVYTGPIPSRDAYLAAWGPIEGQQRWVQFQGYQQQGQFIKDAATLSEPEIDAKLAALRPKDQNSPTLAVETDTYENAKKAKAVMMQARQQDPAGYVMQSFPSVQAAFSAMSKSDTPQTRQAFYASMAEGYKRLGIAEGSWKAFPASTLQGMKDRWATLTPLNKVQQLGEMKRDMGPMFDTALNELVKNGHGSEALVADLVTQSPGHQVVLTDALAGVAKLADPKNSHLRPSTTVIDTAFNKYVGLNNATMYLNGEVQASIKELAVGLYIERGGNPGKENSGIDFQNDKFEAAMRAVVGGDYSNPETGIVDLSHNKAQIRTILPPNTDKETFKKALANADIDFYSFVGNGPPKNIAGEVLNEDAIERDGVFVRVASNKYRLYMGSDGLPVLGGDGNPYEATLTEEVIRKEAKEAGSNIGSFQYRGLADMTPTEREAELVKRTEAYIRAGLAIGTYKTQAEAQAAGAKYQQEMRDRVAPPVAKSRVTEIMQMDPKTLYALDQKSLTQVELDAALKRADQLFIRE